MILLRHRKSIMTFIATYTLKLVRLALRLSGRGRGTALPGLIGEKYFYKYLSKLPDQLEQIIVITGTNGKTTTSKIVRSVLSQYKDISVLSNISGANLTRGILASLTFDTSFTGKIKSKVAVFEVEEASMEKVVELLNPEIILVTNLFRDQMDAYGELDHTREVIENGLKQASSESTILLNANDPKVAYMAKTCTGQVKYYGLDDLDIPTDDENAVLDSTKSPDDRSELEYSKIYFSHIGLYKSKDGKFKTPEINYKVVDYKQRLEGDELPRTSFTLQENKTKTAKKRTNYQTDVDNFKLLGLYNVVNCLAAFAIVQNVFTKKLHKTYSVDKNNMDLHGPDYSKITAAFGRGEKIKLKIGSNNFITLILVKNPTGFNSALGAINDVEKKNIIFALNDNTADGKDVSWIWDCNFEALRNYKKIVVAGERGADLALRCKYAEIPNILSENYENAIKDFLEYKDEEGYLKIYNNTDLYALCSYTALLDLRKYLSTIADVKHIEEEI